MSTAIRHVLAWLPDLQPLLEAFLDEKLQPPIDLQAAVDVQEGHRSTPLEVAIKGGHPAFVRTLIEHGADVTRPCGRDPNGQLVWPVQALSMYVQSRNGPMQTPLDTATNSLIATLDAGARAKRYHASCNGSDAARSWRQDLLGAACE